MFIIRPHYKCGCVARIASPHFSLAQVLPRRADMTGVLCFNEFIQNAFWLDIHVFVLGNVVSRIVRCAKMYCNHILEKKRRVVCLPPNELSENPINPAGITSWR